VPQQMSGIRTLIQTLLRRAEASYPNQAHRVWEVWEEAVGPDVAKRSSPLSLRRGSLLVGVVNAPWMQQLSFLRETIRDSVNRRLEQDLVREVRFRLAEIEPGSGIRKAPAPPPWLDHRLDARTLASIEDEVSTIGDPELRDAVRQARIRVEQFREFTDGREGAPPPGSGRTRFSGGRGEGPWAPDLSTGTRRGAP
jgi:predicted nucleic acid-binding Zn ribbon protein